MTRLIVAILAFACMSACAERGDFGFAAPDPQAATRAVWAAAFRPDTGPEAGQRSPPRPETIVYERYEISIPSIHTAGQIEWPRRTPDAATDFVTLRRDVIPQGPRFAADVGKAATNRRIILFVHGYNYTHAEAVYQTAQIAHDFDIDAPMVLFSWPSAGTPAGYLYDRDSVLIARDKLEDLIITLAAEPNSRLEIVAHSMGNFLVMETLRQIEIANSLNIQREIAALIMISPDIDGELFYTQASRLKALPREAVVLAARQDRALRLSALLTGRTNRLGSETDRKAVRDLPITVVDTSDLAAGAGGGGHSIPFTSPQAIAVIKGLNESGATPEIVTDRVLNLADLR